MVGVKVKGEGKGKGKGKGCRYLLVFVGGVVGRGMFWWCFV